MNLGCERAVSEHTERLYAHHSVKKLWEEAKDMPGGPYKPKANYGKLQPIYVD